MSTPGFYVPPMERTDPLYAAYTVEVTNGCRTVDVLVVAASATMALMQAEELANIATGDAYHYTGRFSVHTVQ